MNQTQFWQQRARLVGMLNEAAELEHALCCLYLYAAFSMKVETDATADLAEIEKLRVWKGTMLAIARQEMEHLAIASNLLTAVGEAPYLRHPNLPTLMRYYPMHMPLELRPLSLETLGRFVVYELPNETGTKPENQLRTYLNASNLPEDAALLRALDDPSHRKGGVEELYDDIRDLFAKLGKQDETALFSGPPAAQVSNTLVFETFPVVPKGQRVYDVLVATAENTQEAIDAVDQIRAEGEGVSKRHLTQSNVTPEASHFGRFAKMYQELSQAIRAKRDADLKFVPGRPMAINPFLSDTSAPGEPAGSITEITSKVGMEAVGIYDDAYNLLLRMLIRFFAMADDDRTNAIALQTVAFFPLMTLVMRPLGDMLAQLPATDDPANDTLAGPTYACTRSVGYLPDPRAAYETFMGELLSLSKRAGDLAKRKNLQDELPARISLMSENLWRMAYNLATALGMEVPK